MKNREKIKEWLVTHKYGVMGTVIFHLLLGICLVSIGISGLQSPEQFDIELAESMPEELKKEAEKLREEQRERTSREEVQKMLRAIASNERAERDASTEENIERYIEEIKSELNANRKGDTYAVRRDDNYLNDSLHYEETRRKEIQDSLRSTIYSGESSVSYNLEGRYSRFIPIPVFKCEFGGKVVVKIAVDRKGIVQKAEIDRVNSAGDICLLDVAKDAALRSRFNQSAEAPALQEGTLTFNFVKQ